MKYVTIVGMLISAIVTLVSPVLVHGGDAGGSFGGEAAGPVPENLKKELEKSKTKEGLVEFYGKVVDQTGAPVAGARVTYEVLRPRIIWLPNPPFPKVELVTDADGLFRVDPGKGIKGVELRFESIEKDGYDSESVRAQWPDRRTPFIFGLDSPQRYTPKKGAPEVFPMRKKLQAPALLLGSPYFELRQTVTQSGKTVGYDFARGERIESAFAPDLRMQATFDPTSKTWTVVLSPGNASGGILALNEKLYEAPLEGYLPDFTFLAAGRGAPTRSHIYLRSREPAIYTRIDIRKATGGNDEFFVLYAEVATNPYGGRDLEPVTDKDLPGETIVKLRQDAREALRKGKLAARPDFPMLMKAAKKKGVK